jgi:hypothetical protein
VRSAKREVECRVVVGSGSAVQSSGVGCCCGCCFCRGKPGRGRSVGEERLQVGGSCLPGLYLIDSGRYGVLRTLGSVSASLPHSSCSLLPAPARQ